MNKNLFLRNYNLIEPNHYLNDPLIYICMVVRKSKMAGGFTPGVVNCKKGCTWLAAASDEVYQLLAHGR